MVAYFPLLLQKAVLRSDRYLHMFRHTSEDYCNAVKMQSEGKVIALKHA